MASRLPLGVGFMGIGTFLVWGGVSGRLAPMLAAVFEPSLLTDKSGGSGLGNIGQDILNQGLQTILSGT